jgi:hypothetical protein
MGSRELHESGLAAEAECDDQPQGAASNFEPNAFAVRDFRFWNRFLDL